MCAALPAGFKELHESNIWSGGIRENYGEEASKHPLKA